MTYYIVGLIGLWIFSDGVYSLMLYLSAPGHSGVKQTWRRDHWVRVVRGLLGLILIVIGGANIG